VKGAILLSEDAELLRAFARALRSRGVEHDAAASDVVATDTARGLRFMLERMAPGIEWSYRMPPHFLEPGVPMPDLEAVVGYGADCRSEEFFAEMAAVVASGTDRRVWVLDENSVIWDAADVDPARVHL